jgi:hypothetical protein
VRFRMECVREGVSLGEAGERRGDGGCWGRGLWFSKGRWGLGRRRGGLEEAIRRRERESFDSILDGLDRGGSSGAWIRMADFYCKDSFSISSLTCRSSVV